MRHHRVSETQKSPESPTDTGVTKGEVDAADAPPLAALWLRNDLALEEQGTASATTVCSARRCDTYGFWGVPGCGDANAAPHWNQIAAVDRGRPHWSRTAQHCPLATWQAELQKIGSHAYSTARKIRDRQQFVVVRTVFFFVKTRTQIIGTLGPDSARFLDSKLRHTLSPPACAVILQATTTPTAASQSQILYIYNASHSAALLYRASEYTQLHVNDCLLASATGGAR